MDKAFRNVHFVEGFRERKNYRLYSSKRRDFFIPFRITEAIVFGVAWLESHSNSASAGTKLDGAAGPTGQLQRLARTPYIGK